MNKALLVSSLEHRIRPLLAQILPPEDFVKIYSRTRPWYLDMLRTSRPQAYAPLSPTEVCGVKFRNDLVNAAGLDKNGDLLGYHYLSGAGGGVIGTILDEPNEGNVIDAYGRKSTLWTPLPRSKSALNTLGLPHHGVDDTLRNIYVFLDHFQPRDFPIIASLMGHPKVKNENLKLYGLTKCLDRLLPVVDMIEDNESCPNTEHGHAALDLRLKTLLNIRDSYHARNGKYVPIFVKLRDMGEPDFTVKVMTEIGVDGLVLTNTQIDYDKFRKYVHPKDLRIFDCYLEMSAKCANGMRGGMSGPIIKEFVFSQIEAAADAIERQGSHLKIIHVGGIGSFADMERSRRIAPGIVKLREWLTSYMNAQGNRPVEMIYPNMVFGPRYYNS